MRNRPLFSHISLAGASMPDGKTGVSLYRKEQTPETVPRLYGSLASQRDDFKGARHCSCPMDASYGCTLPTIVAS